METECRYVFKLFLIATFLTLVTNFPSGFTNSSINTAVEELSRFINESYLARNLTITSEQEMFVRSITLNCWFFAQIFGAIVAPILTDRYGRKIGYITSAIVMLLASILQYLAPIYLLPEFLIAGRSLCAFCSPLSDAALVLYLQESTPVDMRGAFSFMCDIGYGLMCLLGMILGMHSVLGSSLTKLLGVAVIPQIFFVFFLFFIPETPKYLMITKNDRAKALKSLQFFQGDNKDNDSTLTQYANEAADDCQQRISGPKDIFCTWHLRRALILASMILAQTLAFYPVLQSSTYFFEQTKVPSHIAEASSTILMFLYSVSTMFGTLLIDRFSHRKLLFYFGALANIALLIFVITSTLSAFIAWLRIICLFSMGAYIISYGVVLGPMSWFIGPALVPQRHRSTVLCYAHVICEIFITTTNFFAVYFYKRAGSVTFIPLFIIPSTLALFYLYAYLPETRNRDTDAIVESLKQMKPE